MNEEKLRQELDKLIEQVQSMPPERHLARTLQALEHAVYCLNQNPENNTGNVA